MGARNLTSAIPPQPPNFWQLTTLQLFVVLILNHTLSTVYWHLCDALAICARRTPVKETGYSGKSRERGQSPIQHSQEATLRKQTFSVFSFFLVFAQIRRWGRNLSSARANRVAKTLLGRRPSPRRHLPLLAGFWSAAHFSHLNHHSFLALAFSKFYHHKTQVGSIVVGLLAAYGLGLLSPSTHDSTLPPATAARIKNWKHFPEVMFFL